MIEEVYCSFEVAKLLKEKGFDESCECFYDTENNDASIVNGWMDISNSELEEREFVCYSAPTHQMAMAWLREVHNLYICPKYCCFCGSKPNDRPYFKWEARILKLPSSNIIYPQPLDMCDYYETYEEAVEAALKYVLENLI